MKVDVHNHAIPREALDLLVTDKDFGATIADGVICLHDGFSFPLLDSFHDPKAKLAELAENQLDAAVLSIAPPTFFYDLSAVAAERYCMAVNEGFIRFVETAPEHFRWFAHVPMQDLELVIPMMREAKKNGAIGVEIATSILSHRPDDPKFEAFWREANDLGLLVMMHPWYNAPFPGLEDWFLQNAAGNPQETMVAGCRIICSGLFDRYDDLHILLVHGGGNLPYQLGRLRHAISVRPELKGVTSDPWSYCGRLLFDTLTHDDQATAYLIDRVSSNNVFVGTDLPFDMAQKLPITRLQAAVGKELAHKIHTYNPSGYFGFRSPEATMES